MIKPESLQPSSILEKEKSQVIPQLVRKDNDKFWVIEIKKYADLIKSKIKKFDIDKGTKDYLIGLVDFMNDDIDEKKLKSLYTYNKIENSDIVKNFGEILGPFYALKVLNKKVRDKMFNIVFPTKQNYEIFDFFIKDGVHYGFSSKALVGGSNPLVPRLFIERLEMMKKESSLREYSTEITVLKELTDGTMFTGPFKAFSYLMKKKKIAKGFDRKIFSIFNGIDIESDADLFDRNKDKFISQLKLNSKNLVAYDNFLKNYIEDTISSKSKTELKTLRKKDSIGFITDNVVYGMIKYISSVENFKFDEIMKELFPDLYVIKMGLSKDGVPSWHLQTTVKDDKVFQLKSYVLGQEYAFRSKAAWSRVRDKLGVQL